MKHRSKICRTCNWVHGLMCYYKHPTTADGRMSNCKGCHIDDVTENRQMKQLALRFDE